MIFRTDKNTLTIELHGKEQFFAVKAKVVVKKKDIQIAAFRSVFQDWRKWQVRAPGAGIPKRIIAGSFWTEEGWDFLYLTNPHGIIEPMVNNVLFIETNQNKFKRIVVSCDPKEAAKIVAWAEK